MRRLLAVCAAAVGIALAVPAAASAHAVLDSSSPAASTVLADPPREISLTFSENVESSMARIRLFDAGQREVTIGKAQRLGSDPRVVVADVPRLDDGLYVVVWHVVSADGHPVDGAFPFEVGDGSSTGADRLVEDVLTRVDSGSPLGIPLATARFLAFVSMMVLVGAIVLSWGSRVPAWVSLGRTMRLAAVWSALGSLGVLLLQGPYASGRGWADVLDADLIVDVLGTRVGIASLARLGIAGVFFFLASSLALKNGTGWRNAAWLSCLVLIGSWSVSGHPSAESWAWFFVPVDMVHLAAVSAWVGGLVTWWVVRRDARDTGLAVRFSRIATVAMPVAVATGALQGLHIVGLGALLDSRHGRLLTMKIVVVALVVTVAVAARRRLLRGAGDVPGRVIRLELAAMTVVVALSSLLVGTSPVPDGESSSAFNATLVQSSVVADIAVVPARTGSAEVHVTLSPPGGALAPASGVTVRLSLPSRDLPAIPVDMLVLGPNHWSGVVRIPYPGEWTLESRVTTHDDKVLLYRTVVSVRE